MRLGTMLALTCVALVGCGGAEAVTTSEPIVEPPPPAPVSARGATEVRASVGAAGGTLTLANGARLTVPAGALEEMTEIVFHVGAEGHAFADGIRQRPLGPMLSVQPLMNSASGAPFELSVPAAPIPDGFEQSDLAFAIEVVDPGARAIDTLSTETRWRLFPVAVEDGRFVVRTTGLAGQRVRFGVAR